jgi:hypothetical protein
LCVCYFNVVYYKCKYKGGDIKLSSKVTTYAKDFEFLENYKGQELIVTEL